MNRINLNISILIVILQFMHAGLNAQRFDWVRFTPTSSTTSAPGEAIACDQNGHIYTAQRFFGHIVIDGDSLYSPAFNATNFLLTKWNQDGDVVHYKTFHSTSNIGTIQELVYDDVHDQIIVTVATQSSVMIDDVEYSGVYPALRFSSDLEFVSNHSQFLGYYTPALCKNGSYYSTQGYSSTITKTDAENNVLWSLSSTNGSLAICDMAIANDSTFYAIGFIMSDQTVTYDGISMTPESSGPGSDIGMMKIDTNGHVINAVRLGRASSYLNPMKLSVDQAGDIYVAASYALEQTIGGITIPPSIGANDAFVAKLDTAYTALWITDLHQTGGNMEMGGLCMGPDGEIVVTGLYGGTGTFGSFTLPFNSYGMCYMAVLDSASGTVTYAERYGTVMGTSRPLDIAAYDSAVYSTGLVFSSTETNAEFGCYTSAQQYFYLTKFSIVPFVEPTISLTFDGFTLEASTNLENADIEWSYNNEPLANASGTSYTPTETGTYSVTVTSYGCTPIATYEVTSITIEGCTNTEACNFSPEANTDNGTCILPGDPCDDGNSTTSNDLYDLNCECAGTVGINEMLENNILIYPNPVQTDLHLTIANLQGMKNIQIVSIDGIILLDEQITKSKHILSLETLAAGVYFAQVSNQVGEVLHRSTVIKK